MAKKANRADMAEAEQISHQLLKTLRDRGIENHMILSALAYALTEASLGATKEAYGDLLLAMYEDFIKIYEINGR